METLLCSLTERNEWLAALTLFFLAGVSSWMQQSRMKRGASAYVKVILCWVIKATDPQIEREASVVLFPTDGDVKSACLESRINFDWIKTDAKPFKCSLKIQKHYKCENGGFHNGPFLNRSYLHLLMSVIQWPVSVLGFLLHLNTANCTAAHTT